MDDDLREAIEDLLLAAVHRDPQTVTEAVWDLCTTPPTTERQRLQSDITELVTEYAGQSIGSVDVGMLVDSLTAVVYENHLFLPPGVMLLLRMLASSKGPQAAHPHSACSVDSPYVEDAAAGSPPDVFWLPVQRARGHGSVCCARPERPQRHLASMRAGTLSVSPDHRRLDLSSIAWCWSADFVAASGSSLLWSLPLNRSSGVCHFRRDWLCGGVRLGLSLFRDIRYSEHPPKDK